MQKSLIWSPFFFNKIFDPKRLVKTMGRPFAWMPNIVFTMVRGNGMLRPNQVAFRVSPTLSKYDIRNYVERLYNVNISRVDTVNYEGRVKRGHNGAPYKRRQFKKAIITLDHDFKFPDVPMVPAEDKADEATEAQKVA